MKDVCVLCVCCVCICVYVCHSCMCVACLCMCKHGMCHVYAHCMSFVCLHVLSIFGIVSAKRDLVH